MIAPDWGLDMSESENDNDPIIQIREKIAAAKIKAKPEKRPVGRPSKYCPEFCELAIEMGKLGYSPAMIAAEFDVDKASMYDWGAASPEFSTALTRAKTFEQSWWERQGMAGLRSREFNANLWIKSAQARFREDYTERRVNEMTGANGGAVQVETKSIDTDALSQDQRDALRELILAAKAASK